MYPILNKVISKTYSGIIKQTPQLWDYLYDNPDILNATATLRSMLGKLKLKRIEKLLKKEDLLGFLKKNVKSDIKFHHEFRITLSDCPNACSQPQIKDIGIIGAVLPAVTEEPCTLCEACVDSCAEGAVSIDKEKEVPVINFDLCLKCGKCIKACPTGTIASAGSGFRVLLGGKLGRHPRLARELGCLLNDDEVVEIVKACISLYKKKSVAGKRFAEIFDEDDFSELEGRFCS